MTLPALPGDGSDEPVRPLPDYEPASACVPRRRRALRRARLTLVPPPLPPARPPVPPAALTQVLRQVLEVLDRRRPLAQLRRVLPARDVDRLLVRLLRVRPGGRHVLRSIHTCAPSDTALEVCAVIDYRPPAGPRRVFAAVARFEDDGERWACTVLRLL